MVHNEDIKKNIDQIQSYVAVMSIFLDFILRDYHILVRAECVRQRNKVAIKLGIISLSSLSPAVCSKP